MPKAVAALPPKWTKSFNSINDAPAFMSIEEASILFRIPQDMVRKMCQDKTFVAAKLGREWRIDKEKTNQKLFGNN